MPDVNSVLTPLVGLTLGEARDTLKSDAQIGVMPLRIMETAPPPKPLKSAKPGTTPKRSRQNEPQTQRITQWGEWRVLRCRLSESDVELLVAREELRPQEVASEAAATSEAVSDSFISLRV